jgi:DNA-binding transcriptional LysR family regulator
MPDIHFSALDLNLLRVFDALAEERNVTRAGARLGLTQSAVSHALGRLRYALQDELFVRGPDGMRPTARAQEIAPHLRQGLHQLQLALAPTDFVPSDTRRRFTIAAGGYVCTVLMPLMVAELRQIAPGVELRLQTPGETLGEDLQTGRTDIAIGGFGRADTRYERETLFQETTVWVMRADHPAAAANQQTVQSLAAIAQVSVASAREEHAVDGQIVEGGVERRVILDDHGAFAKTLAASGLSRITGVTAPDVHSALAIVSRTDMAALVPRRMAAAYAVQYGLKLFEPPYAAEPVAVEALWRRDLSDSPSLDWLRGCLRAAAGRVSATPAPGSA